MVKMSEEPDDYEGPWPEGDSMTEWVMVPREPTANQLVDGGYEIPDPISHRGERTARMVYRAMLDAAPAAAQQAEPVAWVDVIDRDEGPYEFHGQKLLPRGKHSLYLHPPADEVQTVPEVIRNADGNYVIKGSPPVGPLLDALLAQCELKAEVQRLRDALEKIKLETFDDSAELIARRALAVKLDAIRAAPQQAEPRIVFHLHEPVMTIEVEQDADGRYSVTVPTEFPGLPVGKHALYLHPPPDEVQRLRDSASALCGALTASELNDRAYHALNKLHRALEGK